MGPAFSKRDGMGTVKFQEAESIWVPMEHHEYSDTATIGNPFCGSAEKGKNGTCHARFMTWRNRRFYSSRSCSRLVRENVARNAGPNGYSRTISE